MPKIKTTRMLTPNKSKNNRQSKIEKQPTKYFGYYRNKKKKKNITTAINKQEIAIRVIILAMLMAI